MNKIKEKIELKDSIKINIKEIDILLNHSTMENEVKLHKVKVEYYKLLVLLNNN